MSIPSPQQRDRQERVKELTDKLEEGLKDLFNSENYKQWLVCMSRFHKYSLNNSLLITLQRPDATLVASYTSWIKQGRFVKRGEKGISIFAPITRKHEVEQYLTDPNTGEILTNSDGTMRTETVEKKLASFKVVSVFDISQTEGKELPSISVNELTGEVEQYESFFEALKRTCPVPVEFEQIESGAKGYFHHTENRIAIQQNMSQAQTIKTAVHEMAHQKLHSIDPLSQTRNSKEVEAESVAFVVCQHYGIDTSDYSFGYIAGWSTGKESVELKASLNTIRNAANEMIADIDRNLLYVEQEKTKTGCYRLNNGQYLSMQEASDGSWDYTLYSSKGSTMDGGQIGDSSHFDLMAAAKEVLSLQGIRQDTIIPIPHEQLENTISKTCLTERIKAIGTPIADTSAANPEHESEAII